MMVSFLADECFSGPLLRAMKAAGYDVVRSQDIAPAAPDERVLAIAFVQGRVLLTEDNDFGDLVVRFGLPNHGVVRVALKTLDKAEQVHSLLRALNDLNDKVLGALVTIEPKRTRVRELSARSKP